MQIVMHETLIVNTPPTAAQLRRIGWNAFLDGIQFATLATDDEKAGWKSAHRAEQAAADAETSAYLGRRS